jgi:phytoene dehydrogenase-like protein
MYHSLGLLFDWTKSCIYKICEKEGYKFDAGPSLFTQPSNLEELFALAGEDIAAYFKYESLSLACRYFFENGKNKDVNLEKYVFNAYEKWKIEPD